MPPEDEAAFLRAWNERRVAAEAIAARLASRLHLLHLIKLWLGDRLPLLLLLACLPHSLITEGLAFLAERRRAWYIRHRETLLTAALVQMAWTVAKLATDGAMDAAYRGHRGSAALLLLLIVLTNFTMGLLVLNIYMRLRLRWSAVSLLLQAMVLPAQLAGSRLELAQALVTLPCAYPCCASLGGSMERKLRCSACRVAWYCGTACSHADWRRHRKVCKALGEQRLAAKAAKAAAALEAA
ncbi:MYND finger [Chlorella sorokiniana]|uniref:MYND finger n=1 Tax=Chlorella sorokiniana TaxID=3076 RepID=A0A2P6TRH7_CHLSO|nr:MYND finger [Chlorella sorokiniana]|eukprot:PRW56662.1 MYND finger [Chlorella sorokiniana]